MPVDAFERPVDRRDRVLAGGLGSGLEIRLVDLDHVGAGRLQVARLVVDRGGVGERQLRRVAVEVVLRLLRHRERPGNA